MGDGVGYLLSVPRRTTLDRLQQTLVQTDTLRDFVAIWRDMCRGEVVPPRAGFNPLRFGAATPHLSLLEIRGPDDVRFRLGSRLVEEAMGRSLTSISPLDLLEPAERPIRFWRYQQILQRPCGFYQRSSVTTRGRVVRFGEVLLLPLGPRPGGFEQILHCADSFALSTELGDEPGPDRGLPRDFCFVDIGAGTPEEDAPPS
ncbi:PAS domain-containing protein [Zavarzinia sp. CC-PAN008]|uniref:PAS domain-containing protein n=1 Tax=Zavarzinia sp. CC-PAN008 TaxID=3243332 RepID=UPI003F7454C9